MMDRLQSRRQEANGKLQGGSLIRSAGGSQPDVKSDSEHTKEIAMNSGITIISVLAVFFLATLIRSAFGFGEALVAVPLLALLIPVEVAAPVAVLVSITVAGLVLIQDWREVHLGSAWRLVLFTFLGIPFGLLLLTTVAERSSRRSSPSSSSPSRRTRLVGTGRLRVGGRPPGVGVRVRGGGAGGRYGMNGPPLVVYGALRRWSPERFRATLQGYFLPASLVGMVGYWVAGLWVPAVTRYYLTSLPVVLAAIFLGRVLNRRMDGRRFLLYVHVGLVVIGAVLLIQSVWMTGQI